MTQVPLVDLAWQHQRIAREVEAGVADVIRRGAFVLGEEVERFERAFAKFCGVEHCIGVGNGTDALELAIRALGIGRGDRVVVPVNSFVASAVAVLRAGADVVFVDCDEEFGLIDVERVATVLDQSVKAVMPVHLYGQMAPVERIAEVVGDLFIIEDAAQSHGARRYGAVAGSIGEVAATSFYPAKNLGAYGDAGAVLTSSDDLADRVRRLRSWGSDHKYLHPEAGFNSRLDTLQAVVLLAKLRRLAEWNALRAVAAQRYIEMLADVPEVRLPCVLEGNEHVWHLFVIRVPNRDEVVARLRDLGIEVGMHYPLPLHLQGAMRRYGHRAGDFPVAERWAQEVVSLPLYPGIDEATQERVVDGLLHALGRR